MDNQKPYLENGQKKNSKRTTNHLQNITQKTTDRSKRTPLSTGNELMCSGRVSSSCSTCDKCYSILSKIKSDIYI